MSTYLRKCIDIAPTAVISPQDNPPNDYRKLVKESWWPALRATTSWARFWADWPSLQPVPGQDPDGPSVVALDAQVEAALADGMQIIMLPYRYPRWSNGTADIVKESIADDLFFPQDRVATLSSFVAWRPGTPGRPNYKTHEYRMPIDGFKPGSAWADFVAWLWERYADRLAAFEVVNEPNGQLWPQRSTVESTDINVVWGTAGTSSLTAPAVADMITTVDALARRRSNPPILLAPSCSDSVATTARTVTPTLALGDALLTALEQRGFTADDRWIWSYHNYIDVERKMQQVVDLRRLLAERGWAGRRLDGGPEMWATEGGCRLAAMITRWRPALGGRDATAAEQRVYQGLVMTEALSRHHYAKGAGAGVGMMTQYTTYADSFNSGVLEAGAGGAPRPALKSWCDVPEYFAAPVQRAAWRPQL